MKDKNSEIVGCFTEFGKFTEKLIEFLWLTLIFIVPLVFLPNIFTTFELTKVTVFKVLVILMMLLWFLKYFVTGKSQSLSAQIQNKKKILDFDFSGRLFDFLFNCHSIFFCSGS